MQVITTSYTHSHRYLILIFALYTNFFCLHGSSSSSDDDSSVDDRQTVPYYQQPLYFDTLLQGLKDPSSSLQRKTFMHSEAVFFLTSIGHKKSFFPGCIGIMKTTLGEGSAQYNSLLTAALRQACKLAFMTSNNYSSDSSNTDSDKDTQDTEHAFYPGMRRKERKAIQQLLDAGADVLSVADGRDRTVFDNILENGFVEAIQMVLALRPDIAHMPHALFGTYPHKAIMYKQVAVFELLLNQHTQSTRVQIKACSEGDSIGQKLDFAKEYTPLELATALAQIAQQEKDDEAYTTYQACVTLVQRQQENASA